MNNPTLAPFVWRWWWVLLTGALIAGAVGYGVATTISKVYEAETELLVGPLNTTLDLDASGTLARTYAQLGAGRPVLARAISMTGAPLSPEELSKATTIESNALTRILSIRVQDTDPGEAAELANAIAARLIEMSSARRARTSSGIDAFEREPEIEQLDPAARLPILDAAERVFNDSVAGRLHVTDSATAPDAPTKPSVPLIVIVAALGGLLITAAGGMFWESAQGVTAVAPPPAVAPVAIYTNGGGFAAVDSPSRDQWGALIGESRPEGRDQ